MAGACGRTAARCVYDKGAMRRLMWRACGGRRMRALYGCLEAARGRGHECPVPRASTRPFLLPPGARLPCWVDVLLTQTNKHKALIAVLLVLPYCRTLAVQFGDVKVELYHGKVRIAKTQIPIWDVPFRPDPDDPQSLMQLPQQVASPALGAGSTTLYGTPPRYGTETTSAFAAGASGAGVAAGSGGDVGLMSLVERVAARVSVSGAAGATGGPPPVMSPTATSSGLGPSADRWVSGLRVRGSGVGGQRGFRHVTDGSEQRTGAECGGVG